MGQEYNYLAAVAAWLPAWFGFTLIFRNPVKAGIVATVIAAAMLGV